MKIFKTLFFPSTVTGDIRAEPSRIQKSGKRYNGFPDQQNMLSHKWFKNTTDLDNKFEHVLMVKTLIYFRLLKSLMAVSTSTAS